MIQSADDDFTFASDASNNADALRLNTGNRSSYSLLLLFYLTTVAAIVVAACRLAFVAPVWTWKIFFFGYAASATWLVILAGCIGYWLSRRPWGIAAGAVAGLLCGMLMVLMVLVEPLHYLSAGLVLGVGSWALALIAVVASRLQHRAE